MSKYKLQRYKSAGLTITVDGRIKDYMTYNNSKVRIGATQNLKTGRVITGLTEEDQAYFERELNLNAGELSPKSKFWNSWGVIIESSNTKVLDDEVPEDALAIKVLIARDDVATSTHDAKTKLRAANSPIEYILTNSDSEADGANEKMTWLTKAVLLLSEMNVEQMRDYITMTGGSHISMSDKLVKAKVSEVATTDSKKFVEMSDNPNKKEILLINELVNYAVIKKFNSQFIGSDKNIIAFNLPDMISFIKNPENSKQVAGLRKELAIKKREV